MKKTMKKVQSKTDDLLKRLGASLRESPLNAHARAAAGQGGVADSAVPAGQETQMRAGQPGAKVASAAKAINMTAGQAAGAGAQANLSGSSLEKTQVAQPGAGALAGKMAASAAGERSLRDSMATAWQAANDEAVDKRVVEAMRGQNATAQKKPAVWSNEKEEVLPPEPVATRPQAMAFAEGVNEVMVKTAAPLTAQQVDALQGASAEIKAQVKMKDGAPVPASLQETLEKLGVPMDARQMQQIKELQTMREAIAEIKKLQSEARAAAPSAKPMAVASVPSTWQGYAAGAQRQTQSGWKTSTVGLYPEDYDKAYEVMNYLRAQTGQAVNLSRVIKIALRALEIGPGVIEINENIRAKDGRLVSRRG